MSFSKKLRISDFCKTGSGGTPSRANPRFYENGTIPWVKSGELRESSITNTDEKITPLAIEKSSAKVVPAGSILLAMYGANVGRLGILDVDAATNQAICNIRPDPEVADRDYLYRALEAKVDYFLAHAAGGAQPNISQRLIRDTHINLPPLDEQKRIAAILDKADALRRKREKAIALTDDLLRSVFLDMFDDKMSDENKCSPLGKYVRFITSGGRGWAKYYSESGSRFIRSYDVQMNKISNNDTVYVAPPDNAEAKRTRVEEGDVLLTITGSKIGRAAVVPISLEGSFISQHVSIIRVNDQELDPIFLTFFLCLSNGGQRQIRKKQYGQAKPGLNFDQIRSFLIPKVNINEQRKFRLLVHKVYEQSPANYSSTRLLDSLFESVSQHSFRGEKLHKSEAAA